MPRLEDGELTSSASKFKKRRAWIMSDDQPSVLPVAKSEEKIIESPALSKASKSNKEKASKKLDYNKSITRVEHDCNKSVTRLEHDYNKTVTRVEQPKPSPKAALPDRPIEKNLDYNKSITRVEHDYNMSVTRVEHDYNKNRAFDMNSFYAFILTQRTQIDSYDDDMRCMLLSLSDVQRRIFWHVAFECINRGDSRTTGIEIKSFFEPLGIDIGVVRTSLNRLNDKRLLQREKGKRGKNGFAIIALPKTTNEIAQELITNFKNSRFQKA
jgi:hypothetical protein